MHRCQLCLAILSRLRRSSCTVGHTTSYTGSSHRAASSALLLPALRYTYDSQTQQWIKRSRPPSFPRHSSKDDRQERAAEAASIEATGDTTLGRPVQPTDREVRSASLDADNDTPRYVRGQDSSTLKVRLGQDKFKGLSLPIRPSPPESDSCCMSGCPRCVYDIYTEDLQLYHEALSKTRRQLRAKGIDVNTWPEPLVPSQLSNDGIPVQDEAMDIAAKEVTHEIRGLDISLRTFLQFERELRRKRATEQAKNIGLEHITGMPETKGQDFKV